MGLGATEVAVGEIVWEAVTFPAAEEGTAMLSEAAPVATMDPVLEAAAAAAPPVREAAGEAAVAVEAEVEAAAVVDVAGEHPHLQQRNRQELAMNSLCGNGTRYSFLRFAGIVCLLSASIISLAQEQAPKATSASSAVPALYKTFDTPQQAASAVIEAADKFDVSELTEIFGPETQDVIFTGEFAQDREHAAEFVKEAREKNRISMDPQSGNRAFLLVGNEEWPFPVPLVKKGSKWSFDTKAGRQELMYRRIGSNELDAITICHGYVEAQQDYALQPREGYEVNQYAQRIISTPGKQDGLAWQDSDGTWEGPIGEKIAEAIQQGYDNRAEPYHGYFFKILKGQGPAAPLGRLDFVINGVMIGGFALVAAPAEYGVTGIKTFVVSHDGVVYEKDMGPKTLDEFQKMELYNPDKSWTPVKEQA